jgi:hypothetical protein
VDGAQGRVSYQYKTQTEALNAGVVLLRSRQEWKHIRVIDRTARRVLWDARLCRRRGAHSKRQKRF